jgi:hypothetical protein
MAILLILALGLALGLIYFIIGQAFGRNVMLAVQAAVCVVLASYSFAVGAWPVGLLVLMCAVYVLVGMHAPEKAK